MDRQVTLGEPTAVYGYRNAAGKLVYEVCRYGHGEGKTFRQRRKTVNGWAWNVDGVTIVPYRLPELLAAPADAVVWIVEGEKDADALAAIGMVATCNPCGAGKWKQEISYHLAGRKVAIVPDNDDAGRKHAADVAAKLAGHAAEIKVIELPGLPPKGDVSDFLKRNTTKADLEWLYHVACVYEAPRALKIDLTPTGGDDVIKRASAYVAGMPAAISGESGHDRLWRVACVLVCGFGLSVEAAYGIIEGEYNLRCVPPWSKAEIEHKLSDAAKEPGERGYLLREQRPAVQKSLPAPQPKKVRMVTAEEAAVKYIEKVRTGGVTLTQLGLPGLDEALDGGVDFGEMIVIAARPSHGKSMVAMQALYAASEYGIPSVMVSAEMSAIALGKRTALFASEIHAEKWQQNADSVIRDIRYQFSGRAPVWIVDEVSSVEEVEAIIEHSVTDHGVRIAAVDYAQLLTVEGKKTAYERASAVSSRLAKLAKRLNIVLIVLCQLGRDVERRESFLPKSTDIKDSGQFEQDADVVIMLCWKQKIDPKANASEYIVFVDKNRNREIRSRVIQCKINPQRQKIENAAASDPVGDFYDFNQGDI